MIVPKSFQRAAILSTGPVTNSRTITANWADRAQGLGGGVMRGIPRSTRCRLLGGASAVGIGEELGEPGAEGRGEAIERRGIDEADVDHVEEMDSILEAEGR